MTRLASRLAALEGAAPEGWRIDRDLLSDADWELIEALKRSQELTLQKIERARELEALKGYA